MKYFDCDKMEKLKAFRQEFPFVTVDLEHPSCYLFNRFSDSEHRSVINLSQREEQGVEAVVTFYRQLIKFPSYHKFEDEFGDEWSAGDLRRIVRKSFAAVRIPDGAEVIGPISDIVDNAPAPVTKDDEEI